PDINVVDEVTGRLRLHCVVFEHYCDSGEIYMDPTGVKTANNAEIDAFAGDSRIPILFCGPLMHAVGAAFIPDLGGCKIGDRPIDFYLEVLRQFGAEISTEPTGTYIRAPRRLTKAKLELPYLSVGATTQILLTSA